MCGKHLQSDFLSQYIVESKFLPIYAWKFFKGI